MEVKGRSSDGRERYKEHSCVDFSLLSSLQTLPLGPAGNSTDSRCSVSSGRLFGISSTLVPARAQVECGGVLTYEPLI